MSSVSLGLGARNLPDKDYFSKSDPFCVISRPDINGGFKQIRVSETKKNTLNPDWSDFLFRSEEISGNDVDLNLKIEVYDDDGKQGRDNKDKLLGQGFYSLKQLEAAQIVGTGLPLHDGKRTKQTGTLIVRSFKNHWVTGGAGAPVGQPQGGQPGYPSAGVPYTASPGSYQPPPASSPYPPPGGFPYPPQPPGVSPYPPQPPGSSPYPPPPLGGSAYPPQPLGGSQFPQPGGYPQPSAGYPGAAPTPFFGGGGGYSYAQSGESPYPGAGSSPYPGAGGAPYPGAGGAPYPYPAGGANPGLYPPSNLPPGPAGFSLPPH